MEDLRLRSASHSRESRPQPKRQILLALGFAELLVGSVRARVSDSGGTETRNQGRE